MNEEQKLFLATKYREMPEKELLDMLKWNKNDYEDGVYDLVVNAVKERRLDYKHRDEQLKTPTTNLTDISPLKIFIIIFVFITVCGLIMEYGFKFPGSGAAIVFFLYLSYQYFKSSRRVISKSNQDCASDNQVKGLGHDAAAYFDRGMDFHDKKKFNKAIINFNKAINLKSDFVAAYTCRGMAYCSNGEYATAIIDFNNAIKLKPDYAFAYTGRGMAYYYKREYDKAIADYSKAIGLHPDDIPALIAAYSNRGAVYSKKGDKDKANKDFKKSEELKNKITADEKPAYDPQERKNRDLEQKIRTHLLKGGSCFIQSPEETQKIQELIKHVTDDKIKVSKRDLRKFGKTLFDQTAAIGTVDSKKTERIIFPVNWDAPGGRPFTILPWPLSTIQRYMTWRVRLGEVINGKSVGNQSFKRGELNKAISIFLEGVPDENWVKFTEPFI